MDKFSTKQLLGLEREEAFDLIEKNDMIWEIISEDGNTVAMTDNIVPSRVRLWIQRGIVTGARSDDE